MTDRRLALLLPTLGLALAGCPDDTQVDQDAAATPDAHTLPGDDSGTEDAGVATDAFANDAFTHDAFAPSDAGLPAIANPEPHLVPTSAAGHDRFYGVVFAPDSSFYVVGVRAAGVDATTNDFETVVGHFTASGEIDTAFGTDGWFSHNIAVGLGGELARGIALQSDGKIVVTATVEHVGAADARDRDIAALRLNTDGTLDTTFGTAGVAIHDLSDGAVAGTGYSADNTWNVIVDGEGRLLLAAGRVREGATDTDFGVVRLTSSGALDTTFGTGGVFSFDLESASASVRDIVLLADGTIAGGGYFNFEGVIRPVLYRIDANGAFIPGFGTGGIYTEAVLGAQAEIYSISVHGEHFVTSGYGRDLGPEDNDYITMRFSIATGARDLTYGTDGIGFLTGYDFADNVRVHRRLPDGRTLFAGALRTASSSADAALVVFGTDGNVDTSFGTDGVQLIDFADGTVDHFWGLDIDPRGERAVAVGIGGTNPASDDDGLVYLFPVP